MPNGSCFLGCQQEEVQDKVSSLNGICCGTPRRRYSSQYLELLENYWKTESGGQPGSPPHLSMSLDPAALLRKYSWSGRHSGSLSPGELQLTLSCLELKAIAACQELVHAVKEIHISELLPRTPDLVFINITTVEGVAYCIELTAKGWRVCSLRHDSMNGDLNNLALHVQYFDSMDEVLEEVSSGYRLEFGEALAERLNRVQAGYHGEAGGGDADDNPRRAYSVGNNVTIRTPEDQIEPLQTEFQIDDIGGPNDKALAT